MVDLFSTYETELNEFESSVNEAIAAVSHSSDKERAREVRQAESIISEAEQTVRLVCASRRERERERALADHTHTRAAGTNAPAGQRCAAAQSKLVREDDRLVEDRTRSRTCLACGTATGSCSVHNHVSCVRARRLRCNRSEPAYWARTPRSLLRWTTCRPSRIVSGSPTRRRSSRPQATTLLRRET